MGCDQEADRPLGFAGQPRSAYNMDFHSPTANKQTGDIMQGRFNIAAGWRPSRAFPAIAFSTLACGTLSGCHGNDETPGRYV
jgi:hypothetical protein